MVVEWFSFGAFVVYAYFTYLIAKDTFVPFISFNLQQRKHSLIDFIMVNRSKIECEVFGLIWCKIGDEFFEYSNGFYGNKARWILQPFTEVNGNLDLKYLISKDGTKIEDYLKEKSISTIYFNVQIKYRKVGGRRWIKKWIKTSPQNYLYNFENGDFWLNV